MLHNHVKALVLRSISLGLKAPEARIDRFLELTHLKHLLKELDVNCVIDVGANRGQFAHELRGIGYRGHIRSFEPILSEFASMSQAFADDENWTGYPMALGSREETARINIPRLTVMSSFLKPIDGASPLVDSQEVEMRRLDSLFPRLIEGIKSPRVFLKIDTQGFDLEVFKGAQGCIDEVIGMQSELSIQPISEDMPHYLHALTVYEASGFDLYNVSVVNRVSDGGLLELNCLMRRP